MLFILCNFPLREVTQERNYRVMAELYA